MKYKVHKSGLGVLRHNPETMDFERYDPYKKAWVDDEGGFGTWSGFSSDCMDYTTVPEDKVAEYIKALEDYVSRAPKKEGAAPQS